MKFITTCFTVVLALTIIGCGSETISIENPSWDEVASSLSDFDITIPSEGTPIFLEAPPTWRGNSRMIKIRINDGDLASWANAFSISADDIKECPITDFLDWTDAEAWKLSGSSSVLRTALSGASSKQDPEYGWLVILFVETTTDDEQFLYLACKQPYH